MRNENPSNRAFDCSFKVLGQAAAPTNPCEGPLDNPTTREKNEALDLIGSFKDLNCPLPHRLKGVPKFLTAISAVGEDMTKPGMEYADSAQHERSAITVLNIGAMHDDADEMTLGVGDDVALAAF